MPVFYIDFICVIVTHLCRWWLQMAVWSLFALSSSLSTHVLYTAG